MSTNFQPTRPIYYRDVVRGKQFSEILHEQGNRGRHGFCSFGISIMCEKRPYAFGISIMCEKRPYAFGISIMCEKGFMRPMIK